MVKTVEDFLKLVEPYTKSKSPSIDSIGIILKDEVVSDPDKMIELQIEAKKIGVTCTPTPPGFRIPLVAAKLGNPDITTELLFLHESDIEDGGPQPRLEIRPDDPETIALFESIKPKDGGRHNAFGVNQRDPIDTYPSPLNNGKYRICEGHRRRMVIFIMLRLDGIWAFNKKRTEQQAYEDAAILNNKKNLSVKDKVHHYQGMMKKFPDAYPTLEALAKSVGETKQNISLIMLAYQDVERQKPNLSTDVVNAVDKLPENTIRHIRKVPEACKLKLYEATVKQNLPTSDVIKVADRLKQIPNADAATVETVVKEVVEEKASESKESVKDETSFTAKAVAFLREGEKLQRKTDRAIDKLIEQFGKFYPEKLITAVYGSFGDAKVTDEKFQSVMHTVIGIMLNHSDLDAVLLEASKWR